MLKSMTGYGRGKFQNDDREYTVEIKTVNHRYNDLSIRMPRYFIFLEDKLRQYISKDILRGKIDVYVTVNNLSSKDKIVNIDKELVEIYINEMEELVKTYNIPNDITVTSILKLPDIINITNEENDERYWEELRIAVDAAIENVLTVKEQEGNRLQDDIEKRLKVIEKNILFIEEKSSSLISEYKSKLENRIKELGATEIIDENRLGLEIILFADKSSICEEITRLKSHIKTVKNIFQNNESVIGKKLDFLIQEMNREINTIGAKANSLDITNYVVDTKNELENIREQIQNIE